MTFLTYNGGYSQIKLPTNETGVVPPDSLTPYVTCFLVWDVSAVVGEIIIEIDEITYPYALNWAQTVPRQLDGTSMFTASDGPATAPAATFYRPDLPNAQTGE